jgi:hypothetical protein
LNEGSSTNLLTYSEQFDNSAWSTGGATVSPNTIATLDPYGTNLADKIVEDSSNGTHAVYQMLAVSSSTLTFSCFVKAAESTKFRLNSWETTTPSSPIVADFDLVAVTATPSSSSTISATITPLANGWFRVSATTTTAPKVSTNFFLQTIRPGTGAYVGDGSSGLYVFGAQIEALPFATSYIPTVSSTVTRAADILNVDRAGNLPNIQQNGTISVVCDVDVLGKTNDSYQVICGLYMSYYDFIWLCFDQYLSIISRIDNTSVLSIATSPTSILPINTTGRVAQVISVSNNTLSNFAYLNGVKITSNIAAANTITMTGNSQPSFRIGATSYNITTNLLYGHISNFRVYDRALTAYEVSLA